MSHAKLPDIGAGHSTMGQLLHEPSWRDFARWCRDRRLRPLPAHPWTVAAYVRWCERRQPFAEIVQTVRAIARAHRLKSERSPGRHPTVLRTLRIVETCAQTRGGRSALFAAEHFIESEPPSAPAVSKPQPARRRMSGLRSSPRLVTRRPPSE